MNKISTRSPKLSYRAEIDGLRAIAVISVILYHAKMIVLDMELFEGGFIGVDIFFVISGYLITRIILIELYEKGTFSFLNFYERRARRILPMLFLVIFVSIPFAWLKLLPSDLIEFAESIVASLFFGSNFFFYFSTTEYGADSALLTPLLHTWSLGVEEQFYLVFPIIVIMAFKYARTYFLTILVVLLLLSLQFSLFMEERNSDLNFYFPFSRFWELAVGSVLALRELTDCEKRDNSWVRLLPIVGLYLIVYSIFSFDNTVPHPSLPTVVPILGVALVISFASKDTFVGKLLGHKAFVWVGLISYSAYLWHFPVFAFWRIETLGNVSNLDKVGLIFLIIILSTLSHHYIESPFRKRELITRKMLLIFLLTSLSISLVLITLIIKNNGFEERFSKVVGLANHERDNAKLRKKGWLLLEDRKKQNPKFLNVPNKVLVVGNSHGRDTFNALYQNRDSFEGFDFLSFYDSAHYQINCFNESVGEYESVRETFFNSKFYKDATVILISTQFRLNAYCHKQYLDMPHSSDLEALPYLINRAKTDGKKVLVMGNTPEFRVIEMKFVTDYVFDQINCSDNTDCNFDTVRSKANQLLYAQMDEEIQEITKEVKNIADENYVGFYDKLPIMCNHSKKVCDAYTTEGFKTLYDYGHYTLEGAKYFGAKLANDPSFVALISE